jgi:predicted ATP-grasp superfamily ATP-dependent carboligase
LGGPSALAEAVPIAPQLLQATTAIMKQVGLTGPAMVEFKIDRKTSRPFLMEINGRFWGSVLLASAAGLDLPFLFWKVLNGLEISPAETSYRAGVRGRYLVGDTKCLALCLKGKPAKWPGEFPARWPTLKSYIQTFFDRRTKDLILTRDDPKPFFARLVQDII